MSDLEASLTVLPQADGSASYTWQGYSVLASVNGPIEPQRRDELVDEAFIEVNIKQTSGGSLPRDRHLESLLQSTFRDVIHTEAHPGTLIQLTLQILAIPPSTHDTLTGGVPLQSDSIIPVLPHLVNAGMFAILDGNIQSRKTCAATAVSIVCSGRDKTITLGSDNDAAVALHAFVVSSEGDMLLVESEGEFDVEQWKECARVAEVACIGAEDSNRTSLLDLVREVVEGDLAGRTKPRAAL